MPPVTDRPRILVWAPALYESGFKQHHVDGDALAVQAWLRAAGYHSVLLDAYYRGRPTPGLHQVLEDAADGHARYDVVVAHLFTSDAYGPRLRHIADQLAAARLSHGVTVIGFGPLAVSAAAELRTHGAVDHIVGAVAVAPLSSRAEAALIAHLAQHLRGYTPLDSLTDLDLPYAPDAVVSVAASRGCRSRCTFCAYNADLPGGGWHDLPMTAAVGDIVRLHQLTAATAFAFTDSDFGGNQHECHRRAVALRDGIRHAGLHGTLTFAISVRSESLTEDSVNILAEAGVRTMLLGVESFNPDTLHRRYGKRQDLAHLHRIVAAADIVGIAVVASYILWHPWQTVPDLRTELEAVERFGRHRIPQFMTRSRLRVIPGTVIERQIRTDGLLIEAPFHREFRIADPDAAALDTALQHWFAAEAAPVITGLHERDYGSFERLAAIKIAEWTWLTDTVRSPHNVG